MGAGVIHARDLDHFVAEIDRLGGFGQPRTTDYLSDFEVRFDTKVDQQLDPFSETYYQQQERLHAELAGGAVTPDEGEQYPFDVKTHAAGCNPYNLPDIRFISKHTRAIHTCLMLANLPPHANVLDAGAGWGLSSEAMAFCGANVTALDINPHFVELVRRRAERLSLPIKAVLSEFDSFHSDVEFDLLMFYECLHHSRKPWETLTRLGRFVKPDGKVVFAGEPINTHWWKHWGIRLDSMSMYCIRKHGWWESGWSRGFISRCFLRAGFALTLYDHIGLDNTLIGVALRESAVDSVRLDLSVLDPYKGLSAAQNESLPSRDEMLASRSWRLTAPLRVLAHGLRRLRGFARSSIR